MTVIELIAKLQQFPPELPVCVNGYEGGVDDKFEVKDTRVIWDSYKEDYDNFGDHEEIWYPGEEYDKATRVVLLERQ